MIMCFEVFCVCEVSSRCNDSDIGNRVFYLQGSGRNLF
jgi:hypothetical protein